MKNALTVFVLFIILFSLVKAEMESQYSSQSFFSYSPYNGCQRYESHPYVSNDIFRLSKHADDPFCVTFAILGNETALIQLTVSPYQLSTNGNNQKPAYTVSKYELP